MSVPHDVSMRQLRRRFGSLSKLLSQEEDGPLQDEEILAAFQKIKVAFDELRAAKIKTIRQARLYEGTCLMCWVSASKHWLKHLQSVTSASQPQHGRDQDL